MEWMNDLSALPPLVRDDAQSSAEAPGPPCLLLRAEPQTVPLVFVSPHSGARYTPAFQAMTRLDPLALRRSEDSYVDQLFASAPAHGAPLLVANFPRAYCDVNRDAWELDPAMFDGPLPPWVDTRSARAAAGFGTVPRLVGAGLPIYAGRLGFEEAELRVAACWTPFHAALSGLVAATQARFGRCVLIDCHSMPRGTDGGRRVGPAYVLGDAYGSSAAQAVTARIERALQPTGRVIARNDPYAGGFITRHYGRPKDGVHAVQVEIARDLYMSERTLTPNETFAATRAEISAAVGRMAELVPSAF